MTLSALWCAIVRYCGYTVSRNNYHDMRRARQSPKLRACLFCLSANFCMPDAKNNDTKIQISAHLAFSALQRV